MNGRETRDYNEYLRWGGPSLDSVQEPKTPEQIMREIAAENQKQLDAWAARSKEFDTTHPFSFDEILAEASAAQRFDPYYDSQLKDFMAGIMRQRESLGQESELIKTLNVQAQGEEARNLGEAIRASAEGASQSGLFFSGARQRETGLKEVMANEQANTRELTTGFKLGEVGRQLGQTQTTEESTRRGLRADRATAVQTDIEKQKAEEQARRAYEKAQYVGVPPTGANQSAINQLLGYTYTA